MHDLPLYSVSAIRVLGPIASTTAIHLADQYWVSWVSQVCSLVLMSVSFGGGIVSVHLVQALRFLWCIIVVAVLALVELVTQRMMSFVQRLLCPAGLHVAIPRS